MIFTIFVLNYVKNGTKNKGDCKGKGCYHAGDR